MALRYTYGLSETHSHATMLLDEEFAAKPGSVHVVTELPRNATARS